jgi:hypothetical protein
MRMHTKNQNRSDKFYNVKAKIKLLLRDSKIRTTKIY